MSTQLNELLEFLHHGNAQIRQIAVESLAPYSLNQPTIFHETAVTDLKLLIKDYPPIATHAVTILTNLSSQPGIRDSLASDKSFLTTLSTRICDAKTTTAEQCMLLSNLSKSAHITSLLTLSLGGKPAITALLQLALQNDSKYDYLLNVFADIATLPSGREYFTSSNPAFNNALPLSLLTKEIVSPSPLRQSAAAALLKNVLLTPAAASPNPSETDSDFHTSLLNPSTEILLSICTALLPEVHTFTPSDLESSLPSLLSSSEIKSVEIDTDTQRSLSSTLLLFSTTATGRAAMREQGVYAVVREAHLAIEDAEVRATLEEWVDRVVGEVEDQKEEEVVEEDKDKVVDVF